MKHQRESVTSDSLDTSARPVTYQNLRTALNVKVTNVRSIVQKIDFVRNYLSIHDTDLLFITESWLTKDILSSAIHCTGYNILRSDRQFTTGGGVILLFKEGLKITEVINPMKQNTASDNFEVLCVDYHDGKQPIRLCCFYVPPRSSQNKEIIMDVCKTIEQFQNCSKPFFTMGDFNLPQIDWKNYISLGGKSNELFIDFCTMNCFSQHVLKATHEKGSILDILLCNTVAQPLLTFCNVIPPISTNCDYSVISFNLKLREQIYWHKN